MWPESLQELQKDLARLTEAAKDGQPRRARQARSFKGAYAEIVRGVNGILDAVIAPLNVAANYVDRISHGDIPAKITDTYNGDFNTIKNNLNTCIDAVNALVADAGILVEGGGRRQTGHPRRRQQAPGRLPQDRARRQRNAGRGHRPAECGRQLCRSHQPTATFPPRSPTPTTATSTPSRTT